MRDVLQTSRQRRNKLLVERASHFGGVVRAVDGDDIVVFATLQLGYEVLTRACAVLLGRWSVIIAVQLPVKSRSTLS